jgi:hypothetical protein
MAFERYRDITIVKQGAGDGAVQSTPIMAFNFTKWLRAAHTWTVLFVVGCVAILGDSASCQLSFGSIAVLQSADDYLIVAADSQKLSVKGVSLHSCKVDALDGQLVFANTGYGSYEGVRGKWDAIALARQHYHQLAKAPRHDMIPALAEAYGADLAAKLKPDLMAHPEEGWPQVLATALFAGFDENRERVVIEVNVHQVTHDGDAVGYSTKRLPASDAFYAEVLGETSIAEEFATGRTLRSQSWRNGLNFQMQGLGVKERLIAGAENIVELTARYRPSVVGGAVDTVLVSRNTGVVWIHRKPECAKRFGY